MADDPIPESISLPLWVRKSVEDGERLTIQAGTNVDGQFSYMAVLQEFEMRGYGSSLNAALEDLNEQLVHRDQAADSARIPRLAALPLPSRPTASKPKNPIESLLEDVEDDSWEAGSS